MLIQAVLLVSLGAIALADKEYDKEYKEYKKTHACYQCSYTPPTVTYKEVKVPRVVQKEFKVRDGYGYKKVIKTKTVYDIQKVAESQKGGWDKCKGTFTKYQADQWGIDQWDCEGNCYVRREQDGRLVRGCYHGEFGVNQHRLGCSWQQGTTWCFCKGDRCNNQA